MKKIKDELISDLKGIMDEKGLSASGVSRFIGCNQAQVSRWIRGQARPNPVYRKLIRKAIKRLKSL